MTGYDELLLKKRKSFIDSGFEIAVSKLSSKLKDFQKYGVQVALRKGKFAFFFDCGLGKTFCQLEWAKHVSAQTLKKVIIVAPLAVVEQTKREAVKFKIKADCFDIDNFEQLENIDVSIYGGVVIDESSRMKSKDGKTSKLLLDKFRFTSYKLCCTATPSPNDHMELGMHSEFLGAMSYLEMLAMYFVHDGGETSKWRLRKHAKDPFWKYVSSWSMAIDNPATLGFDSSGYNLPEIEYVEHIIPVENNTQSLFGDVAVSATDLHKDLSRSFDARIAKTLELVNSNDDQWIVWGLKNNETDTIAKLLKDAVNVQGSDSPEYKAKYLNGFAKEDFKTLVTKTSIASFGMNYQQCHQMVYMSYDFSFEKFYQGVRRCYRFGQKNKVQVHILVPESQINVRATIIKKEREHRNMIAEMAKYSAETNYKANRGKYDGVKEKVKLPSFI